MTGTLTLAQRRLLALLILLILLGLLASVTVLPVLTANRYYSETIETMASRLDRLRHAAAIASALQPQSEQLRSQQAEDAHYLRSDTAALAAAELQRIVTRTSAGKNAQILSTQILSESREGDFTRIGLKVRMRGTLEGIIQVFYALESGEPYLFLDKVSLRARSNRYQKRGDSVPETLDTDFELTGYLYTR